MTREKAIKVLTEVFEFVDMTLQEVGASVHGYEHDKTDCMLCSLLELTEYIKKD